jgi:hypothetical protein
MCENTPPFFALFNSIGTTAKSITKLKSSFQTLCQNEKGYIALYVKYQKETEDAIVYVLFEIG